MNDEFSQNVCLSPNFDGSQTQPQFGTTSSPAVLSNHGNPPQFPLNDTTVVNNGESGNTHHSPGNNGTNSTIQNMNNGVGNNGVSKGHMNIGPNSNTQNRLYNGHMNYGYNGQNGFYNGHMQNNGQKNSNPVNYGRNNVNNPQNGTNGQMVNYNATNGANGQMFNYNSANGGNGQIVNYDGANGGNGQMVNYSNNFVTRDEMERNMERNNKSMMDGFRVVTETLINTLDKHLTKTVELFTTRTPIQHAPNPHPPPPRPYTSRKYSRRRTAPDSPGSVDRFLFTDGKQPENLQKIENFKAWLARCIFLPRSLVVEPFAIDYVPFMYIQRQGREEKWRIYFHQLFITTAMISLHYAVRKHDMANNLYHNMPMPYYVVESKDNECVSEPSSKNSAVADIAIFMKTHIQRFLKMDSKQTGIHKADEEDVKSQEFLQLFESSTSSYMKENWHYMDIQEFIDALIRKPVRKPIESGNIELKRWELKDDSQLRIIQDFDRKAATSSIIFVESKKTIRVVTGSGDSSKSHDKFQDTLLRRTHLPTSEKNWFQKLRRYRDFQRRTTEEALDWVEGQIDDEKSRDFKVIREMFTRRFPSLDEDDESVEEDEKEEEKFMSDEEPIDEEATQEDRTVSETPKAKAKPIPEQESRPERKQRGQKTVPASYYEQEESDPDSASESEQESEQEHKSDHEEEPKPLSKKRKKPDTKSSTLSSKKAKTAKSTPQPGFNSSTESEEDEEDEEDEKRVHIVARKSVYGNSPRLGVKRRRKRRKPDTPSKDKQVKRSKRPREPVKRKARKPRN